MSSPYESFNTSDFLNDYEAMESDRAYADAQAEERYRDAEINYGIQASSGAPEPYYEFDNLDEYKARTACRCALCLDPRELPAAMPPARETRIAAPGPRVIVAEYWNGKEWGERRLVWDGASYTEVA